MASASARALAAVSDLAAGQWGLLTTAQADLVGVTRVQLARLADAGVLERVGRGVYATAAAPTENRALRAAWLSLDPTRIAEARLDDLVSAGVASHTSAAGLHRLGDLLDDVPELTLPHRKQTRREVRLHQLALTDDDITLVDGMPTTTAERTVLDLLRDGHDVDHVAQILGQGVRRGVIDVGNLATRLEPLARRHGQENGDALVEHLLDMVGLSSAALTRELVASPAGQGLVNVGRLVGMSEMLNQLLPAIETSRAHELDTLTESLGQLVEAAKAVHDHAEAQELAAQVAPILAVTNTPAFRAVIAAANASTVRDAQRWANAAALRGAGLAAAADPRRRNAER